MSVIERRDELEAFFHDAGKPREQWRVGTEYEKVGIERDTAKALSYSGPRGVRVILEGLVSDYGWEPQEEDGFVIGLKRGNHAITLEPGGQIELSGEPCDDIHCSNAEFSQHIRELIDVAGKFDVVFLGLGMQPFSRVDEIEWLPKRRYRIMGPYMAKVGSLGQRMMKQTATVQANIDYGDETDAMAKLRTAMGLAPIIGATFANSPISDGEPNGFKSYRGHIWTRTDADRCGLLEFCFSPDAGFHHYVEYALDVPMYLIARDGNYLDMTGIPFRHFLEHGHQGHRATMADWQLHLTTLFPEVRLKHYMEFRSADSQAPELMPALPALIKGICYDADCLQAGWDLVKGWSFDERMTAYHDSHRLGLAARFRRYSLGDLAKEMVDIAWEGLARQRGLNKRGEDETIHLKPLRDLVQQGLCPADVILSKWQGEFRQDLRRLIEDSSYKLP